MKYNILITFILLLISSQFVFSDCPMCYIKVNNNTDYTVAIENVESLSTNSSYEPHLRKVWDLGPYEQGSHKDSTTDGGQYDVIGIGGESEGHVIIIKDGKRSDDNEQGKKESKIRMADSQDPQGPTTHGTTIHFDNRVFVVTVQEQRITEEGVEVGASPGGGGGGSSEVGVVIEGKITYPLFTVTINYDDSSEYSVDSPGL